MLLISFSILVFQQNTKLSFAKVVVFNRSLRGGKYIAYKIGPSIEPCIAPPHRSINKEFTPSIEILKDLQVSLRSISRIIWEVNAMIFKHLTSSLVSTRSKAAVRSMLAIRALWFVSTALEMID
jgi:hypothetical protein